jgi:aminoglycoside phosphotransferase (APT) family kinase protein
MQRLEIPLPAPEPQADTDELRTRFLPLIDTPQRALVADWCDWTDSVLAAPPETEVLVHGDLHGFNLVWDANSGAVRLVADWDAAGLAERAYDFRYLPGLAATAEFFGEVRIAYQRAGGRPVDPRRVMAWHIRSALGDALWRTEAGVCLPGGGTASSWVGDVNRRMRELDIR